MYLLLFKSFLRSTGVKAGLIFLLTAGVISLFIGRQFLQKQKYAVEETSAYQKEHIDRNRAHHKDELGLLLYYIKFALVNETSPLNGLSVGQRDVNSSIQRVTIRGLEAQKYDSDLNNPYNLLSGNMDFSFVLIYLFPLFIIALSFSLVAEERESGTWKIVIVQSKDSIRLVLKMFAVRLLATTGLLLAILGMSIPLLGIIPDTVFFSLMLVAVCYVVFWYGVCYWVSSLQKKPGTNVIILLITWLLTTIVLPAGVNNFLTNYYPIPEAFDTAVKQRKGYHEKWDTSKMETMSKFYAHYPQLAHYRLPEDKEFSWLWYYAMQQMGDDDAAGQSASLRKKLEQRNLTGKLVARFIPPVHVQLQLNELVNSGLTNQLRFLDRTGEFHEGLRLHFYPKIFDEDDVESEDWDKFKVETFKDSPQVTVMEILAPLLVFTLGFVILGGINFRRRITRV